MGSQVSLSHCLTDIWIFLSSDLMDGAADVLQSLPVEQHHIFDLVHFILCIQADRADLGEGFETTSRINPLASWTSAIMACFAGGLLVNPLCGEPLLAALGDSVKLAMASVLWFLLYYCPQDLAFQFSKIFPVRIVLYLIKALYYPKKVLAGIKHAGHVLPGNFLAMLLVAVCKGNGSGIIKPFCRLVRGVWSPSGFETLIPSVTSKYCLLAALLFYLLPGDVTYVAVAGLFLTMKVGPLFGVPVDLFSPVENKICPLIMGLPEQDQKKTN